MKFKLSEEEVREYAKKFKLDAGTSYSLLQGDLQLERVQIAAENNLEQTVELAYDLDCTDDEPEVQPETTDDMSYLISKDGLAADGVLLFHQGEGIGVSLSYPIKNEKRPGLPQVYSDIRERAQWGKAAEYLSRVFGTNIGEDDLHHLYTYAVAEDEFRCHGLGRLIMRYTLDNIVPYDRVSLGFIDSRDEHAASMIATMKSGRVIGKEVNPSPDGTHSSFLAFSINDMELNFTGRPINYNHKKDDITKLPAAIREIVADDSLSVVAYNPSTNRFEEARLH